MANYKGSMYLCHWFCIMKKVEQLHETGEEHSWWKQVQQFLNIKPKPAYSGLDIPANKSAPSTINEFFVSVADDLEPLRPEFLEQLTDDYSSEFIIEVSQVETRLSNINIYNAQLPSWI